MIRLNVPVSMKCKTDKPGRHKDGSGHHHPMRIFPIEQQVDHFGRCSLSRLFPLRPSAPSLKIEEINDCKGEQRDQKPLPFDIAGSPKLSIEVSVA
jgi:hypothetical protein